MSTAQRSTVLVILTTIPILLPARKMSRFVSAVTATRLPSKAHHCVPEEGSGQMSGGWMTHPNNSVPCTEAAQCTFIFQKADALLGRDGGSSSAPQRRMMQRVSWCIR